MNPEGNPPNIGIELIAAERKRQITAEGWTSEHDDQHTFGELARAGACYAAAAAAQAEGVSSDEIHDLTVPRIGWPWDDEWWKIGSPIGNLAKAGALIAAEIDRQHRAGRQPWIERAAQLLAKAHGDESPTNNDRVWAESLAETFYDEVPITTPDDAVSEELTNL